MKQEERKQSVKTTRNLVCVLTDDEKRERGRSLADMEYAMDQIEREKKSAMDTFKDQISATSAGIYRLATEIRDGFERRDVDCEWIYHWDTFTKELVRHDTEEIIETKVIEADERQLGFGDAADNN